MLVLVGMFPKINVHSDSTKQRKMRYLFFSECFRNVLVIPMCFAGSMVSADRLPVGDLRLVEVLRVLTILFCATRAPSENSQTEGRVPRGLEHCHAVLSILFCATTNSWLCVLCLVACVAVTPWRPSSSVAPGLRCDAQRSWVICHTLATLIFCRTLLCRTLSCPSLLCHPPRLR